MNQAKKLAEEIQAEIRGHGGLWETTTEDVLGENFVIFKNRNRSIYEMLKSNVEKWGERECLILEDTRISYHELLNRIESTSHRFQNT